jgi:hypothetical protein
MINATDWICIDAMLLIILVWLMHRRASGIDKKIEVLQDYCKVNTDRCTRDIDSMRQDICGCKCGHKMEITNAYTIDWGIQVVCITKKCLYCGYNISQVLLNSDDISDEDRNILKYKFNINIPKPNRGPKKCFIPRLDMLDAEINARAASTAKKRRPK